MKEINDLFFRLAELTLVIMLSAMVIMVFGNVVLRNRFNESIISSEELSRFLFIWVTFPGAIVAMRENAHLGLDSVVRKLGLRGKKIAFALSNVLMLGCCVLMCYGIFPGLLMGLALVVTWWIGGMGRIPMHNVLRGVMPFLFQQVVVMGMLITFPSLVMLPLKWLLVK